MGRVFCQARLMVRRSGLIESCVGAGLPAMAVTTTVGFALPVGARLAREGVVSGDGFFTGVHIRSRGNGGYWFRFYSESLGKTERRPAPSNQALLPLSFGLSMQQEIKIKSRIKSPRGDLSADLVLVDVHDPL